MYTTLLDPAAVDEWLDADAVRVTANQFQRYIAEKDADLRVTAVGQTLVPGGDPGQHTSGAGGLAP